MVASSLTTTNAIDTPEVEDHAVYEGDDGKGGKAPGRGQTNPVAKVEQGGRNGADDDAEFEPAEEGTFGSEVDFWFDADGDVDACVKEKEEG